MYFFDATATSYDGWAGGLHGKVAHRLVEMARPQRGERCLDVGCGTGLVSDRLAAAVGPGGHVVGLDASAGMLAVAGRRARPNADYRRTVVGAELEFPGGTFDLVTFGDSLVYLNDPGAVLRDACRVLRPGGRLAVAVRRHSLDTPAQDAFFGLLEEVIASHPFQVPRLWDGRSVLGEPEVLRASLHEAGFEVLADSTLVTGWRLGSASAWVDLIAGAGPRPYLYLTSLGARLRGRLEASVDREMKDLGEGALHYHEAFSFAVGRAA